MSKTVIYSNVCHFVDAVDKQFGDEYLRSPTESDMKRLLELNARRGFVGMWCSIDCMHLEWQNCPTGWAGQFKGKEKKKLRLFWRRAQMKSFGFGTLALAGLER
ncbi:uncharacterized protein PITG_10216 [Phytophthora infestans T30-4]|nr:uncharacterized protein PITG_10216 [Phytophthora infestans T30-4]EEY56662.1 conserved hypothetical protein [Phytophthora infestans T30-4]|eukprot:XP_002902736.1 conserved hypothetical protein [Phytophthora infestans T30-4]